jgi:hypothetical protein
LGEHPQDVGIEVPQIDGRARLGAGVAPVVEVELGTGLAPFQARGERPGGSLPPGHDLAPPAELLECEDADSLLPQGPGVLGLGRLEEVSGHLAKTLLVHPTAPVLHRDDRVAALSAEEDADHASSPPRLRVLVRRVTR